MLIVAALGGNALLRPGEPAGAAAQGRHLATAAAALAPLACDHGLVVTHGNGPQVGLLAIQAAAAGAAADWPLDVLGAESEGMIGYMLEQALAACLPGREIATLVTLVEVDPADPAFFHPTKPIGPRFPAPAAARLAAAAGWTMVPDGDGLRRVVASPEPRRIRELSVIARLVRDGVIVICLGGGGVPVAVTGDGGLRGVEAVIDKDLAAAALAVALGADALLLLTDVAAVLDGWPAADARPIARAGADDLRGRRFAAGSMGPKVEAACRFAQATGRAASIGRLEDAAALLAGTAGTRVTAGPEPVHG